MNIRKPNLEDLPEVVKLLEAQYEYHYNLDDKYYVPVTLELSRKFEEFAKDAIERDEPYLLIANEEERVIGFVTYEEGEESYFDTNIRKFGTIVELYVVPEFRHKGIGSKLMEEAEKALKEKGYEYIKIQCSTFNTDALKFYNKLSYLDRQTFLFKKVN